VTEPSEALVFGTSPDCDVRVTNEYVSGHHARITRSRGAYYVEDLGSTNGTSIVRDGKRSPDTASAGRRDLAQPCQDPMESRRMSAHNDHVDRLYDVDEVEHLVTDGVAGAGVTTAAAAWLARVAPSTVRSWATRGKLTAAGHDDRGRAYYDAEAVLTVDLAARRTCAGRPRLQHSPQR